MWRHNFQNAVSWYLSSNGDYFSTELIQNSKNKIFGNEIPCILDFSHFEPVEAWIWFPEVMTSKFFEHDNLTSKTYPFPENTQFNKNNFVQFESCLILDHGELNVKVTVTFRVTVTYMSGISVTWFQDRHVRLWFKVTQI